jgi:hypothetical protein
MAQKWHKKTAQSRPSSRLCYFLVRQVTPALSLLCHEFSGFSRKNWVIFPKFQLKSSIFTQKRQKTPSSYAHLKNSFLPKKWHNLEERLFCATNFKIKEKIMTKKTMVIGSIVFATLLIFSMTACDNGSTGGTDTWQDVTSLSQLNGTWKGSSHYSGKIPSDTGMSETYGNDARITTTQEITYTINASAKTLTIKSTGSSTVSGSKMATYWASAKEELIAGSGEGVTVTAPDANHITMVYNYEDGITASVSATYVFNPSKNTVTQTSTSTFSQTFTDEAIAEMLSDVQINQNGTKLKGGGESIFVSSLIFIKQ